MKNQTIITPTKELIEWANCEIGVIIHYDLETFDPSYNIQSNNFDYKIDPKVFNPSSLNTDQWIEAAAAAGAKYAIPVAKHCTGFCLWPTNVHEYSVKNSPWKNGHGDVVHDFICSCKKYGIKPGLYYSTSRNDYLHITEGGRVQSGLKEEQDKYNSIIIKQLTELWTLYGDLFEIWFDGGILPIQEGGPDIAPLINKLIPNTVVFQGPRECKNCIRWAGNESAAAPEDCYSTVNFKNECFNGTIENQSAGGDPFGNTWRPAESDTPNRDNSKAYLGGWFWKQGDEDFVFPPEYLYSRYISSVGHNTNLLIGMAIDNKGLFPEKDTLIFKQFGDMVKKNFSHPLCDIKIEDSKKEYEIKLPDNSKYLVICEVIQFGERILEFLITQKDNAVYSGHTIGHKRIIDLKAAGIKGNIIFKINATKDTPKMKSIKVY